MNRDPLRPITDEEVARYRADGAVCLPGLFDPDWIDALARDVDADMAAPGPMGAPPEESGGIRRI